MGDSRQEEGKVLSDVDLKYGRYVDLEWGRNKDHLQVRSINTQSTKIGSLEF